MRAAAALMPDAAAADAGCRRRGPRAAAAERTIL